MNLKCTINGKEYEVLVQGNTIAEEYNETLDSGTLILSQVEKMTELRPFDDVYIYDNSFDAGVPIPGYLPKNVTTSPDVLSNELFINKEQLDLYIDGTEYKTILAYEDDNYYYYDIKLSLVFKNGDNSKSVAVSYDYLKIDKTSQNRLYLGSYAERNSYELTVNEYVETEITPNDYIKKIIKAGSNLFAIGERGIAKSINNGATWTWTESPAYLKNLNDITYDSTNNVILAVGNLDSLNNTNSYYSVNSGVAWIPIDRSFHAALGLKVVENNGNNHFIAAGENGIVYNGFYDTENNAFVWNTSYYLIGGAAVQSFNVVDIAYGNARFILLGNNGNVYYMNDGQTTWGTITPSSTPIYTSIHFADNKFIISSTGTGITYYIDNISPNTLGEYRSSGLPQQGLSAITYDGTRFVGCSTNGMLYFLNTQNIWENLGYNSSGYVWNDLTKISDKIIVAGLGISIVSRNINGITWKEIKLNGINNYDNNFNSMVSNGDASTYVMVGNGYAYYSLDKINWTKIIGINTTFNYTNVNWCGQRFIMIGSNKTAYQSWDGINWTLINNLPNGDYELTCVDAIDGENNTFFITTTQGILISNNNMDTWNEWSDRDLVNGVFVNKSWNSIAVDYNNNTAVAINPKTIAYYDGTNFTTLYSISSELYNNVDYVIDKYIITGKNNIIQYSTTGNGTFINCEIINTNNDLYKTFFFENNYYCVGDSIGYKSSDGINWTLCYGLPNNVFKAAFVGLTYKNMETQLEMYQSTPEHIDYNIKYVNENLTYNNIFLNGEKYYLIDVEQQLQIRTKKLHPNSARNIENNTFFKHFLIDQFTGERLNLTENLYKYKIEAFSEIKALESIQLPNITITQPLNYNKKKSVYYYMEYFINRYSPKIKVATDEFLKTWSYTNKYVLDESLKEEFENVFSPDFSLNTPNLRDVISRLMITRDKIPYVEDGVVKALDFTRRRGTFDTSVGEITKVTTNRSSDNYCDCLRRTYYNGLLQENSCRRTEFLGLRGSNTSLMTLENMVLETTFPIYKINKIYCCYYKKIKFVDINNQTTKEKIMLCKQDITPLVKLNSERNLLSKDWNKFNNGEKPTNINDLSQFKLSTLGYDIGGKRIEGWGTKYTYPVAFWNISKTYIENIMSFVDTYTPFGIYDEGYVCALGGITPEDGTIETISSIDSNGNIDNLSMGEIINPFGNTSLFFKSLFFEVDYQSFYNGTIIHSKDDGLDNIMNLDNTSASLTLLEQDGLFQKEKINRFGNENISIYARYKNISEVQPLGSVFEDDIIIYSREIAIFDNLIIATYKGTKDYVLKNYFVTVFAKLRTYNLMSYGESVLRSENEKIFLMLSTDKYYKDNEDKIKLNNFDAGQPIPKLLSFFKETPIPETTNYINFIDKINYGYFKINNVLYGCDLNAFVSGYALCLNTSMYDNVTMGVYISDKEPEVNINVEDDYKGSVQDWCMAIDDEETGQTQTMEIYVGHAPQTIYGDNIVFDSNENNENMIKNEIYDKLFKLPILSINENNIENRIGNIYEIHKDNREKIDMTFQIEPITNSKNIFFNQWMMKLSNLLSSYEKYEKDIETSSIGNYSVVSNALYSKAYSGGYDSNPYPVFVLKILKTDFNNFNGNNINGTKINSYFSYYKTGVLMQSLYYSYSPKTIVDAVIVNNEITGFSTVGTAILVDNPFPYLTTKKYVDSKNKVIFRKVDTLFGVTFTENDDYVYFSNMNCYSNIVTGSYADYFGNNYPLKVGNHSFMFNYNCGKNMYYGDNINGSSVATQLLIAPSDTLNKTEMHKKNLFITLDNELLTKEIVYKEIPYNEENLLSSYVISDYVKNNSNGDIVIDTTAMTTSNGGILPQSFSIYFVDNNSYKFVFGMNIINDDINSNTGEIVIKTSLLSFKDTRVFNEQNKLVGNNKNYYNVEIVPDETHYE